MARLQRGFKVLHEEAEQEAQTSEAATPEMRRQASNPHRAGRGQVRPGDKKALEEFAADQNLKRN